MKKFVNILTLIIMVSGNIMTPFAYAEPDAQVVDFFQETENAEDTPEEVLEEVETSEEIDVLDEEDESLELEISEETETLGETDDGGDTPGGTGSNTEINPEDTNTGVETGNVNTGTNVEVETGSVNSGSNIEVETGSVNTGTNVVVDTGSVNTGENEESIEALATRLGIDRETEAVDYAVLAGIPADEYVGSVEQDEIIRAYLLAHEEEILNNNLNSEPGDGTGVDLDEPSDFYDIVYTGIVRGKNFTITLMDRNLGASEIGVGEDASVSSYGYYYQWGNNYPFLHYTNQNQYTTQRVDASGYGPDNRYMGEKFIKGSNDWSTVSNDNLWGGGGDNGENDYYDIGVDRQGPCPDGYYVPSVGEWYALLSSFLANNGLDLDSTNGLSYSDYIGKERKAAYYLDSESINNFKEIFNISYAGRLKGDGTLDRAGEMAHLWTSTPLNGESLGFEVWDDHINLGGWKTVRVTGYPIRCFKSVEYTYIDYEVKYVDGDEVTTQIAHWGDVLTEPDHTEKGTGYNRLGWYSRGVKFDFTTPITGDITLVATWGCSNDYHIEDGLCKPNTKTENCIQTGGVENSIYIDTGVIITWDITGGVRSEILACEWKCLDDFHLTGGQCISNTKIENCIQTGGVENSTYIDTGVIITWDITGGVRSEIPACEWECNPHYHQSGNACNIDMFMFTLVNNPNINISGSTQSGKKPYEAKIELEAYVDTGYRFMGWQILNLQASGSSMTTVDNQVVFYMPDRDVTATPLSEIIEYKIVYRNVDDAIVDNPDTYTVETETFTLNEPIKTGYIFLGWTGSNGSIPEKDVTVTKGTTGNKRYTAVWEPMSGINYQVVHAVEKANSTTYDVRETEILSGTTDELTEAIAKEYTGFTAKEITQKIIKGDGSTVVRVQYQRNVYTISFDSNGGSEVNPITGKYESDLIAPSNPTRAGYRFVRWEPDFPATMPLGGAELVAQWSKKSSSSSSEDDTQVSTGTNETNTGKVDEVVNEVENLDVDVGTSVAPIVNKMMRLGSVMLRSVGPEIIEPDLPIEDFSDMAVLLPGSDFRDVIVGLAGDRADNIAQILYTGTMPSGTTTGLVSVDGAIPVIAGYKNGIIYLTTEADEIYLNEDSSHMFQELDSLQVIDTTKWDTSNVTDMNSMFTTCMSLLELDVSNWDTSNVTDMTYMFGENYSLIRLDVSNWDTSNVTDMNHMFSDNGLTGLDVSNWDTSNVTDMDGMFAYGSLLELDVSNWDTSSVTSMRRMFGGSRNLERIYASTGFVTTQVTDSYNMFYQCTSLVGGNGTTYDSSKTDKTYARIDDSGTPGYFTEKIIVNNPPVVLFTGDTPEDNTIQINSKSFTGQIDITEEDLSEFTWTFSGNQTSLYDDSLVLMYNFDNVTSLGESTALVKDLSKYGRDGTIHGATLVDGKRGKAYSFNGTNSNYIDFPDYGALNQNGTISLWLKGTLPTSNKIVMGNYNGLAIGFNSAGNIIGSTTGLGKKQRGIMQGYDNNGWNHIVVSIRNGTMSYYVNGVKLANDGTAGTLWTWTNNGTGRIGRRNNNTDPYPFNGLIDEIRVYNRALSQTEIQELYRGNLSKTAVDKWTYTTAYTGLANGTYVYGGTAEDTAGQTGSVSRSINIQDAYLITYNLNGGVNDPSNPTTYTINGGDILINRPTRDGYMFMGWTGSNGNGANLDVIIPAGTMGNRTYNAVWLPFDDLNVYFLSNTGNVTHYTLMDRNMGATSINIDSSDSYGSYYKWGNDQGYAGNASSWTSISVGTWAQGEQGPCPEGYHVPSKADFLNLEFDWGRAMGITSPASELDNLFEDNTLFALLKHDLLVSMAGGKSSSDGTLYGVEQYVGWHSSEAYTQSNDYVYRFSQQISPYISKLGNTNKNSGYPVRCFNNAPSSDTLTIDANGGTGAVIAFTGEVGNGKITTLGTPKKTNSVFEGWYSNSALTASVTTGSTVPANLYAKWSCEVGYKDYGNGCVTSKDIILEATATEANQTLKINKYFNNAYTVDRGDGTIGNLTADTTHTYSTSGIYTITLSTSDNRWTFQDTGKPSLVPINGTTMTGVKITYMPSLADGFGNSATTPGNYFFNNFNCFGAITSLPAGSFDTSNITIAGKYFFASFNENGLLTSLPAGSFDTSNITAVATYFFRLFNKDGLLTSLPAGSFDTSNITTAGVNFFESFNENGLLTSLPAGSFRLSTGLTTARDFFFYSFNSNGALTSLPAGSFDTSNITTVGGGFFADFNGGGALTSLPDGSFRLSTGLNGVGNKFFYSFNGKGTLTSLPAGSFDTSHITSAGDLFFENFNSNGRLTSLPEGSFDTSYITSVGDGFFENFNSNGLLTSLPAGSFGLSTGLTTVGDFFFYSFNGNGALMSLPTGSFDTSNITTVGYGFFADFNSDGVLTSLPAGSFDTSNITTVGNSFFRSFNRNGAITNLPGSFKLTSVAYNKTDGYENAFYSPNYTINKNVSDLVEGITAPSSDRNTFSDNQPGRCGVDVNWLVNPAGTCNLTITFNVDGGTAVASKSATSGDIIILPSTIKTGYVLLGWYDSLTGGNKLGNAGDILTVQSGMNLYARWVSMTTLIPGQAFNSVLKTLAAGNSSTVDYSTQNTSIYSIKRRDGIPSRITEDDYIIISTEDSVYPVYAWYYDGTIYYYTEAERVYFNEDSSYMFNYMKNLNDIEMDGWDTSSVVNMGSMFSQCNNLQSLDVSNWDTSKVENMDSLFYRCNSLKGLDVSNWDTSNVWSMSQMFSNCSSLTGLDLSNWDTSKVTNMNWMFIYCSSLTGLDLSNWDTSNVGGMNQMFYQCSSLTELNLSGWDTSSVTDMGHMFRDCRKLKNLNLSSFDTSNVTSMNYMFYNCQNLETIYVSTGFVTNLVTSHSNMFNSDAKLMGGNGTKYDSSYALDKTRAKIDNHVQSGYFTDRNGIYVNFMVDANVYTSSVVSYGDRVNSPSVNPSRQGTTFNKWVDKNGQDYDFYNTEVTRYTEIYATFNSNEAILLPGEEFNIAIKKLSGQSSPGSTTSNSTIKRIVQWTGNALPSGVTTGIISSPWSDNEVIAWYNDGVLYYYTEAEKVYFNPDSSYMFSYMYGFTGLDLTQFDTSKVTNMNYMFYNCQNLINLNLGGWDTSSVTDMGYMFRDCKNLKNLNLSNFDTTNVISMNYMFYNCQNLTSLNLSDWDTSNVKNMNYMFYGCQNLVSLDLSSFDTSKVTGMYYMFYNCQNLETIYATTGYVTNGVTSSTNMFYNNKKLVGGNGTKFNSTYIDKTRARIDEVGQLGYFTDKTAITVKFISDFDSSSWTETGKVVNYGETVTPPLNPQSPRASFYKWHLLGEDAEFDFSTPITGYTELYAKWRCNTGYGMNEYGTACQPGGVMVHFDTDGGTDIDDLRIASGLALYEEVVKYSHTENVDDNGVKQSNYGNNWTNLNIRGTDRTSAVNQAHVLTFPGVSTITVDIYYNGQSTSYDWASVWKGSYPSYTAASNYSSDGAVTINDGAPGYNNQFGGSWSTSYIVNGNTLTSMGHSKLSIPGNTVTFGFKSNASGYGQGYGYYAIVKGLINLMGNNPTKAGYIFKGWKLSGSDEYFDLSTPITSDITLRAQWEECIGEVVNNVCIGEKVVTYDTNGGAFDDGDTYKTITYYSGETVAWSTNWKTPSKSGNTCGGKKCMFDGWYLGIGENAAKWTGYIANTMTVYAKWLPFDDLTITRNGVTFTIMDRNLGATARGTSCTRSDDAACGSHFQWGNNYGFKRCNSLYCTTFPNGESTISRSDIDYRDYMSTYYNGIWNAHYYAYRSNDNLWGGGSSSNPDEDKQGPCPDGYHVPDRDERSKVLSLFNGQLSSIGTVLSLPVAGFRDYSNLQVWGVGSNGSYWTSSPNSSDATYLYTYSSNSYMSYSYRSYGRSVRCFKNSIVKTLDYELNGGSVIGAPSKAARRWENGTQLPEPTKLGHGFMGWYTTSGFDEGTKVTTSAISGDDSGDTITLYAKWEECGEGYVVFDNKCKTQKVVIYDTNGGAFTDGTTAKSASYFVGDEGDFALTTDWKTPSKSGNTCGGKKCMFDGWYLGTGENAVKWTGYVLDNMRVYAKWLPFEDLSIPLGGVSIVVMDRNLGATESGAGCSSDDYICSAGWEDQGYESYDACYQECMSGGPQLAKGASIDIESCTAGCTQNLHGYEDIEECRDAMYAEFFQCVYANSGVIGDFYQWGNNYGFKLDVSDGSFINGEATTGVQAVDFVDHVSTYYNGLYRNSNPWSDTSWGDNTYLWGGYYSNSTPDGDRQGPCPSGYHVPTTVERDSLSYMLRYNNSNNEETPWDPGEIIWDPGGEVAKKGSPSTSVKSEMSESVDMKTRDVYSENSISTIHNMLKLPFTSDDGFGTYWTSIPNGGYSAYEFYFDSSSSNNDSNNQNGLNTVRCFKNTSEKDLIIETNGANIMRWNGVIEELLESTIYITGGVTERWDTDNIWTLPEPLKSGHEFMGWYTTPGFDEGTKVTTNALSVDDEGGTITVYAKWKECGSGYIIKNNRCVSESAGTVSTGGLIKLSNGQKTIYIKDRNVGATVSYGLPNIIKERYLIKEKEDELNDKYPNPEDSDQGEMEFIEYVTELVGIEFESYSDLQDYLTNPFAYKLDHYREDVDISDLLYQYEYGMGLTPNEESMLWQIIEAVTLVDFEGLDDAINYANYLYYDYSPFNPDSGESNVDSFGYYYFWGNNVGISYDELGLTCDEEIIRTKGATKVTANNNYTCSMNNFSINSGHEGFMDGPNMNNTGWSEGNHDNPCDASKGEYLPTPEDWKELMSLRGEVNGYTTVQRNTNGYQYYTFTDGGAILKFMQDMWIPLAGSTDGVGRIAESSLWTAEDIDGYLGRYRGSITIPPIKSSYSTVNYSVTGGVVDGTNSADREDIAMPIRCFVRLPIITYDANGGTFSGGETTFSKQYTGDVTITEWVSPIKTGNTCEGKKCMFVGWYLGTGADAIEWTGYLKEDMTVYAKWLPFEDIDAYFISDTGAVSYITLMDRNMGAISDDVTSTGSYGFKYQWGNNHGFADGCWTNNCSDSVTANATTIKIVWNSGYDNSNYWGDTYVRSAGNPGDYWIDSVENNDNHSNLRGGGTDEVSNHWGLDIMSSSNIINKQGPCPDGYHVPSIGEWNNLLKYRVAAYTGEGNDLILNIGNASQLNSFSNNIARGEFQKDFKISMDGYRHYNDVKLKDQGSYTSLWTTSTAKTSNFHYARYFRMTSNDVAANHSTIRGYAHPVRCFSNDYMFTSPSMTIHPNGGTGAMILVDGRNIKSLGIPHRDIHSHFEGWYSTSEFTAGTDVSTGDTAPADLYAKWSCDTGYQLSGNACVATIYTITYNTSEVNLYDGNGDNPESNIFNYTVEDDITLYTNFKEGYTFNGWNVDRSNSAGSWLSINGTITGMHIGTGHYGNVLLTYNSTPLIYTLYIDDSDCTVSPSELTVIYGQYLNAAGTTLEGQNSLPIPTRYGYDFKGYAKELGGSIVLNYKKSKVSPTIVFNDGNFTIDHQNRTSTIYPVFQPKKTTIVYHDDVNGNISAPNNNFGSTITLLNPQAANHIFQGWYSAEVGGTLVGVGGSQYTFNTEDSVIHLYARWSCASGYVAIAEACMPAFEDIDVYFISETGTVSSISLMDRNLGAITDDVTSTGSYGYHYQWGNNHGFEPCYENGCTSFPGGEETTSTKYSQSSCTEPSTCFYRKFVIRNNNWFSSNSNINLWGGGSDSSSNNWGANVTNPTDRQGPCPDGYHVPSKGEWDSIISMMGEDSLEISNQLNVPFAGYRDFDDMSVDYLGYDAILWSSSSYSSSSSNSQVLFLNADGDLDQFSNPRAFGLSVRCFSDSSSSSVTIHPNGGTGAMILVEDGNVKSLGTPKRANSKFEGWYSTSGFTAGTDVSTGDTAPADLYAKWSCNAGYTNNGASCEDITSPVCTWGTPSKTPIRGGQTGTIVLTCTDAVGIATSSLNASDIIYTSTYVTLSNAVVGGTSTGRTYTFTYTAKSSVNGQTTFKLPTNKVYDTAGNVAATKTSTVVKVDNIVPSVSANNAGMWRNDDITITLRASDTNGLSYAKYSRTSANDCVTNGTSFTNGNTITYITEGNDILYLCAEDMAGNAKIWSGIYKLDKTRPSITFDQESGAANNSHSVEIIATDTLSKLANGVYTNIDGSKTVVWSGVNLTIAGEDLSGYYEVDVARGGNNDTAGNGYDSGNPREERQGPCLSGRHVPSLGERSSLIEAWCNLKEDCDLSYDYKGFPKINFAGNFANELNFPGHYRYRSSSIDSDYYYVWVSSPDITINAQNNNTTYNVRCFKNTSENPQPLKYRWQSDGTCSSDVEDYSSTARGSYDASNTTATATVTTQGLDDGSYYLCVLSGSMGDNAGNVNVTTKTSGQFVVDNTKPVGSLISTSTLKSTSQRLTGTCEDAAGVTAIYLGTNSSPLVSDYKVITSTTSYTTGMNISSAGTYYLFCKDTAGNISTGVSQTYYTYKVYNMEENVNGTTTAYNTTNYTQKSASTYIAPSGTTLTLASIYDNPNSSCDTFAGVSTSAPSATIVSISTTAPTLNANSDYGMWFTRNTYALTLTAGIGIQSPTGAGAYKWGASVAIDTTVNDGYTWNTWTKTAGVDPTTFTAGTKSQNIVMACGATTLRSDATINSYTLTINPNGGVYNGTTSNTTITQNYGTQYTMLYPTKTGYTFSSWQSDTAVNWSRLTGPVVYNNKGGGTVTHEWVDDATSPANSKVLKITTNGTATPGAGGFYQAVTSQASHVYYQVYRAKVPEGYSLNWAGNACGNGRTYQYLTSMAGVGDWATYVIRMNAGSAGTFSTFGHIYVTGPDNTNVTRYVASAQIYDVTDGVVKADFQNIYNFTTATDQTLTAQWTPNTYYIAYNNNGGVGSMSNTTCTYDTDCTLRSNTFTKAGYTFKGWSISSSATSATYTNGQSVSNLTEINGDTVILYAVWKDETKPIGTITTTNDVNATSQTATLSCTDGVGVTSYYRGTTSPTSSSTYTNITSTTNFSIGKSVTNNGTYYLACKDAAGNVSEVKSITYVKYQVKNMLDKVEGTTGTYTTTNYAVDSTKPTTSTYYVIPSGTSLTLANLCTAPSTSSSRVRTSVGEPNSSSSATNASSADVSNQTYVCWYDRSLYDLTLTKNTGIETIYYKVNGASDYVTTTSSKTVQMKAGSNASVYAVASNCYTCANNSCYTSGTPQSWTNITSAKSYSPTATENTNTITYNMNGGTNNANNPASYKITQLPITLQAPTRAGYTFKGWTGANGNVAQTSVTIAAGSCGNKTYNAVWQANADTQYIVYHYVKRVGQNTYELADIETKYGTSDAVLLLSSLAKADGFVCASYDKGSLTGTESGPGAIVTETIINPDGSTKIYLYYNRNKRNVTLSGDEHIERFMIGEDETSEAVRECGSEVPVEAIPKPGYHFVRWDREERTEEEGERDNESS